jgi:hypothetical protein
MNSGMCYIKKSSLIPLVITLVIVFIPELLHAQMQKSESVFLYERSLMIQKNGMLVLGGWATANLITGSIGYFRTGGNLQYLHQMNAAWNTVNLGIAIFAYRGAVTGSVDLLSTEMLSEMSNLDRILLINAGLDLLYMGTGAYLWNRGSNRNSDRLTGYGQSLLIQGGFLLIFDAVLYMIHSPLTAELGRLGDQISFTGSGFKISF